MLLFLKKSSENFSQCGKYGILPFQSNKNSVKLTLYVKVSSFHEISQARQNFDVKFIIG